MKFKCWKVRITIIICINFACRALNDQLIHIMHVALKFVIHSIMQKKNAFSKFDSYLYQRKINDTVLLNCFFLFKQLLKQLSILALDYMVSLDQILNCPCCPCCAHLYYSTCRSKDTGVKVKGHVGQGQGSHVSRSLDKK